VPLGPPFEFGTTRHITNLWWANRKAFKKLGSPAMNSFTEMNLSFIEPLGSRPEPGACLIASIIHSLPGEAPEGRAGAQLQFIRACAPAHSGGPRGKRALR